MSDATVVAASRKWICVRLATYESKAEGKFLESVFRGRMGTLENTTVALLAPDGRTKLARAGRGPGWVLGLRGGPNSQPPKDAAARFAAELDKHAKAYRVKKAIAALPQALDVRRALNIAACDVQPLVVAVAKSQSARESLSKRLAKIAWSDDFRGRLQYIVAENADQLTSVKGTPKGDGIFVVRPGTFGVDGKVLARAKIAASPKTLAATLQKGLQLAKLSPKSHRAHLRAGRRAGVEWTPEMPVTDPDDQRQRRRR